MAKAEITEYFDCTPKDFFKIVSDYESYPDFLPEVKNVKILKEENHRKLVKFSVSLIKSFSYRLWMEENRPHKITWSLDSGDMFKVSNGSWSLALDNNRTRATYFVEVEFKGFVPGPIAKGLVSLNLPNMMSSYNERVKSLSG